MNDLIVPQYSQHWNEKFSQGQWGRYPAEDLVRFIGRNYKFLDRKNTKILEVGSGPGANVWFLHREGYATYGIEGSPIAVEQCRERIMSENANLNYPAPELVVGNFQKLPWPDQTFDSVVDVFAVYANKVEVIQSTIAEIHRVLKKDGLFFSKLWGTGCSGFGTGKQIEKNTFDDLKIGPCAGMGLTHFFDLEEIKEFYKAFKIISIDKVTRTDSFSDSVIEEYACVFKKT